MCLCVCLLSHISPTERLFVLKTLSRTQRATKVKKFVGICLKRLRSRVMPRNMSEKANMLIIPTYRCQLSPLDTQRRARGYPTIVNNIQPCPKLCLLMPLARVGARTDSTTSYSYNARRGQLPRTRIGIVRRTRARHAVCAEGLHFSAFHLFCSERAAFVRTEALCLLSCQHSVDHASRSIEVLTTLVRVLKNCARSNSAAAEAAHLAMHYYVGYCQGYFQEVSCLILQASPTCSSYLHLKQAMVLQ